MSAHKWLILTLLAPFGCHSVPQPASDAVSDSAPPSRGELMSRLCSDSEGEPSCTRRIEKGYLAQAAGKVERNGNELVLHLANGDSATFRDSTAETSTAVLFGFRGSIQPIGYYLIDLQFYEGGGYLLVSAKSGKSTISNGPPLVSPDGHRVAAANVDLESQYTPTTLTIWQVTDDSLALEWRHDFLPDGIVNDSTWGPSGLRWVSPIELRFRKTLMSGPTNEIGVARFGPRAWSLVQP